MIHGACARLTSTTGGEAIKCNDVVDVTAGSHELAMALLVVLGVLAALAGGLRVRRIVG